MLLACLWMCGWGAIHGRVYGGNLVTERDLRGHDWVATPVCELVPEWTLYPNQLLTLAQSDTVPGVPVAVPGDWTAVYAQAPHHGVATYHLRLHLDAGGPPLALQLGDVLTAYECEVNGKLVAKVGRIGTDASSSIPAFAPQIIPLPDGPQLDIVLRVSNFAHVVSGLLVAPKLGNLAVVQSRHDTQTILGSIVIGLLLMNSAYQWMRYYHRRSESTHLLNGLWTFGGALHFSFLHQRWMYGILGNWALAYKLELVTLFVTVAVSVMFLRAYFTGIDLRLINRFWIVAFSVLSALVLALPIAYAAELGRIMPIITSLFSVTWVVISYLALRRRLEGSLAMALATLCVFLTLLWEQFTFGKYVGDLLPVHYAFCLFTFTFSWVMARKSGISENAVISLSKDLEVSNAALAAQNQNLEEQVKERTAALMAAEQEAHEHQLEFLRRDMEALSANNQLKVQLTRNLVDELQALLQAGGDYPQALRSLIAGLRGQIATEERLETLQLDLATVNAEFYNRLQARCPELTKTEREICAYIKLNLSSKDIAQVRKTSINTINVARHRIRKKLGMERDDELERFVQQL